MSNKRHGKPGSDVRLYEIRNLRITVDMLRQIDVIVRKNARIAGLKVRPLPRRYKHLFEGR